MKLSLIGSDNKPYDISWFKVNVTHELYYQVQADGKKYYKQLVMTEPYQPELYINDLAEALRVDAERTIRELKQNR